MLALVVSERSFSAYVCHKRPAGLHRDKRSCILAGLLCTTQRWRGLIRVVHTCAVLVLQCRYFRALRE